MPILHPCFQHLLAGNPVRHSMQSVQERSSLQRTSDQAHCFAFRSLRRTRRDGAWSSTLLARAGDIGSAPTFSWSSMGSAREWACTFCSLDLCLPLLKLGRPALAAPSSAEWTEHSSYEALGRPQNQSSNFHVRPELCQAALMIGPLTCLLYASSAPRIQQVFQGAACSTRFELLGWET